MRRKEFIEELARRTGLELRVVQAVVEEGIELIKERVSMGDEVVFRGFGVFYAQKKRKRIARDINRGKPIVVPPRYVPVFKAYPPFREMVQRSLGTPSDDG